MRAQAGKRPAGTGGRAASAAKPQRTLKRSVQVPRFVSPSHQAPASKGASPGVAPVAVLAGALGALAAGIRRILPGGSKASSAAPGAPGARSDGPSKLASFASRVKLLPALAGAIAVVLVGVVGFVAVTSSPLFAVTDVTINGSAHITAETARRLVTVPEGSTLFNLDTASIEEDLKQNPWVSGITVERRYPHGITITPVERKPAAIAYITASDIAWALDDEGSWIAPISLSVTVDADGAVIANAASTQASVEGGGDAGASAEGTQVLTGIDAARAIARRDGAVLFTDITADVNPDEGTPVDSEVIEAGLAYVSGFSDEFRAQVRDISLESIDAIAIDLESGIEVALGAPTEISLKERVVTGLIEQIEGITYIDARTPESPTYRSAPAA